MKKTIEEIREVLVKMAWNANQDRPGVAPLLVVYPNEVLLELFGEEEMKKHWIPDK